jgi:phage-related protein
VTDRDVRLDLEVTSDASKAADDVRDVADAYEDMAKQVKKAGDVAAKAESKLDGITESADGLASTSSQATGALGALSSGFDLVGLGAYSEALGSASMATDFLSGVGDSLTLVLQNEKAAQIASTVATKAQTAATKAQAVAQRALNLVQAANPIALIVIAVIALIAGLVLLYKRSEKFREIVHEVGEVGKKALGGVVDVTKDLVGFVKDDIPDAFGTAKDLVVRYIRLITTPYRKVYELGRDVADFVSDRLPAAFGRAKDLMVPVVDAILSPFRALRDMIQDVLDLIGKIHIPDLPDLGGLGGLLGRSAAPETTIEDNGLAARGARLAPRASASASTGGGADLFDLLAQMSGGGNMLVNLRVDGALDSFGVAQQILRMLSDYARQIGFSGPLVVNQ